MFFPVFEMFFALLTSQVTTIGALIYLKCKQRLCTWVLSRSDVVGTVTLTFDACL